MLTPVADGVALHRSELLQNQTVVRTHRWARNWTGPRQYHVGRDLASLAEAVIRARPSGEGLQTVAVQSGRPPTG